jgi:uncharacterized protein (DUF427 family)
MSDEGSRNGPGPAPGYVEKPEHFVRTEPTPKRLRATFAGVPVFDTLSALILFEARHVPVYYVPRSDVAADLLTRTGHATYCPFKGEASYWTIAANGRTAENAVWAYERPYDEVAHLARYMAFYWNRLDHWSEEDVEVFVHARSPYVRVDILPSSREVRVVLGGVEVARSTRARFLFETGLPVRYYLPREDVRMDALIPSERRTQCPYKGTASYLTAEIGGTRFEDVVWIYEDPVAESERIRGYLSFYNEKVDAIFIDGVELAKPVDKSS